MKRVRDYIDKDKMNVSEGDMMLTFKEGKDDDAVDKLEEIEGKDGNIKGCDYVVESVEADVDDPSQAYVKIKVGTPKVETLIKNVLKANKVLGDVSDIDADFGKGEAKAEPKAKKGEKKAEKKAEGGEKKAEQKQEQKAEQPAAKKSFKDLAWEKKSAKKADSVNKNDTYMKHVKDENNGRKCLYFVDEDANAELTRRLLNGILHSLKDDPTTVDWVVEEMKKNHCENFVGDWDDEPTSSMMSKDSEDGRYTMYWNSYGEIEIWGNENISDSKKIKDAEEKPLNGMLMVAFKEGTEEDSFNAVKEHEGEQNDSNGIQYEIYSVDEQDGVAMVDLCAVGVKDANEFIKALLKEWGVLDNTADIDFDVQTEEEYKEEQGEEVSDSKKIKDDGESSPYNYKSIAGHLEFVALKGTHRMTAQFEMDALEGTGYVLADYGVLPNGNAGYCYIDSADKNFNYDNPDSECIYFECENKEPYFIVDVDYKNRLAQYGNVSDSKKVNDDDDAFDEYFDYSEEAMEENDKVNDSRRVKDDANNTILHFHTGRGGRFYNQGFMSYEGVYEKGLTDFALTYGATTEGDEEYQEGQELVDESGKSLGAKYGDMVGYLDWDGEYDTDSFIYLNEVDFNDSAFKAIVSSDEYLEPEVRSYIANLVVGNPDEYTLKNLLSQEDDDYEDILDEIVGSICMDLDIKNGYVSSTIHDILDGMANK